MDKISLEDCWCLFSVDFVDLEKNGTLELGQMVIKLVWCYNSNTYGTVTKKQSV